MQCISFIVIINVCDRVVSSFRLRSLQEKFAFNARRHLMNTSAMKASMSCC